jgi:stage II sporulation protein AA (anti-sigma F factor antagonist)
MEVNFFKNRSNLIFYFDCDLDHHNVSGLKEKIDKVISKNRPKNIIFDFSRVNFMYSSGVGLVLGRYKNLKSSGGDVKICGLSGEIKRIFMLSGLQKIIPTYTTADEAIVNE